MPRAEHEQVESYVELYLKREAEALGAFVIKNQRVRNGWPDRTLYWFFGVTDLVETKRPKGGKWEPLQLRTHERLRKRGHTVIIANTRTLVDEYLETRRAYGRLAARAAGIISL